MSRLSKSNFGKKSLSQLSTDGRGAGDADGPREPLAAAAARPLGNLELTENVGIVKGSRGGAGNKAGRDCKGSGQL